MVLLLRTRVKGQVLTDKTAKGYSREERARERQLRMGMLMKKGNSTGCATSLSTLHLGF